MKTTHFIRIAGVVTAWLCLASIQTSAWAGNWPQWRGPNFNGSAADDEKNLPVKFSPEENIAWSIDVPGVGASTPIVWEDRIFLTAMEREGRQPTWGYCFSAADGKMLWKVPLGEKGFGNKMGNTAATPSAITDGRMVIFYVGTGELVACDMDGKVLWKRNIQDDHGKFDLMWKYGSTGLLHNQRLYVPVLHGALLRGADRASYLLRIDPKTGKDIWKHQRTSDAIRESKQAYSTPIPCQGPNGEMILISGGDYLTAHDPETGKELWRSPTYNSRPHSMWRLVSSPCTLGKTAVVCAPKGGPILAVKTDSKGAIKPGRELWKSKEFSPDVCTPLAYRGRFYVLDGRRKQMACIEPNTGKVIWSHDMPAKTLQASPTGADGKIYCLSLTGEVLVLEAGDRYKLLHSTKFPGTGCRATITVSGGRLFLRTDKMLYCIGEGSREGNR